MKEKKQSAAECEQAEFIQAADAVLDRASRDLHKAGKRAALAAALDRLDVARQRLGFERA